MSSSSTNVMIVTPTNHERRIALSLLAAAGLIALAGCVPRRPITTPMQSVLDLVETGLDRFGIAHVELDADCPAARFLDRGDTAQAPESGTDDDGNEYLYGDATTKRDVNPYNVPYYHRPTVKDQGGIDITEVTPDPVSY